MNRNAEILKELQDMDSPLASMSWQTPYSLPEGYFNSLADALVQGVLITELEEPSLTTLPKATPYSVPESYFAGLVDQLKKASENDMSLEQGLRSPFVVPDGYLESLPEQLTIATKAATKEEQTGKVIPLQPNWKRRVIQLAAAAVLALGLGLGSYQYFQPAPETAAVKQLSGLEADALASYVEQHVDDFEVETLEAEAQAAQYDLATAISTLEETEIEDYLMETGETSTDTQNKFL